MESCRRYLKNIVEAIQSTHQDDSRSLRVCPSKRMRDPGVRRLESSPPLASTQGFRLDIGRLGLRRGGARNTVPQDPLIAVNAPTAFKLLIKKRKLRPLELLSGEKAPSAHTSQYPDSELKDWRLEAGGSDAGSATLP